MKPYLTISNTADEPAYFEFEEKKSRFIGQACHAESEEEARAFVDQVRAQNREARHNVFAFVLRGGPSGKLGNLERQSDDGEPQKTAGMPTLEALRHARLTDTVVVVTRYFGGTLLGTGGLVRAYTQAARGALEAANIVEMSECVDIEMIMPYSLYDTALYTLKQTTAKVISTSFTDVVTIFFRMQDGTQEQTLQDMEDLLAGRGEIAVGEPFFTAF